LSEIPQLSFFSNLELLDISFNTIRQISNLDSGIGIKSLDMAGNQLTSFESILKISTDLPYLTSLDLRLNPISTRKGYKEFVGKQMKKLMLANFDGVPVRRSDFEFCFEKREISTEKDFFEFYSDKTSCQPQLFRPLSVRTQSGYGSSAAQREYWKIAKNHLIDSYLCVSENITTLELDNCHLFELDMLPLG
jgi:Leucine-rich repeat (LRR) protein